MDDNVNGLKHFLVWPQLEAAMGLVCNCLVGALPCTHYVIPSSSLCGVKVLPAQTISNSTTNRGERERKRHPGCLAHVVRGVFHCVVGNRRQPNIEIDIPGKKCIV